MKPFYYNLLKITFALGLLFAATADPASAQELKTQPIDLKRCVQTYLDDSLVIKDQASFLKSIRSDASRDWCLKNLEKIDFEKHTLVGIELNTGYCRVPPLLPVRAIKAEADKQYVIKIRYIEPREPCRALSRYDLWLLVPKLPENYTVEFDVKGEAFR